MSDKTAAQTVTESLTGYLDRQTRKRARRGLPAPQVLVRGELFEYTYGDQQMPFHAASVGKLATATLTMQLVESGSISLDSRVVDLLPGSETAGLFTDDSATVEHLLAHTSGVADYYEGKTSEPPALAEQIVREPNRLWQPSELINFSQQFQRPLSTPGARYHYSDTGFVLLGRIIEEVSGEPFHVMLRKHVFEPAGMLNSVLWLREPGPTNIAPAFLGRTDVSTFTSVSADWAGGSIVTTLEDLTELVAAMQNGLLLRQHSFERMSEMRHKFRTGIYYGLGLMKLKFTDFAPFMRGLEQPLGHIGVLATHAFVYPEAQVTVAVNFNGTREMVASFQTHIRIAQALSKLRGELA